MKVLAIILLLTLASYSLTVAECSAISHKGECLKQECAYADGECSATRCTQIKNSDECAASALGCEYKRVMLVGNTCVSKKELRVDLAQNDRASRVASLRRALLVELNAYYGSRSSN